MTDAELSIIDEIKTTIHIGSAEKRLATAKHVTDLFLSSAGSFNHEQIELFGDLLERLIKTIEIRAIADVSARIALAEMSVQLAPVAQAPPSVVRRLAMNDEIAVAGPVLTESARLSTEDLVEIAETKGEQHLLAIETGIRVDLPSALRRQLLRNATEAVRSRLLSRAPPHIFEEIRSAIATVAAGADREMSNVRDFTAAKRLVARLKNNGELNEATLFGFAKQRKYEETVAALAELSRSTIEIIRPLMQSLRDDGVLFPCKAAELSWETVSAVLDSRFATGSMAPHELAKAKAQFAKITPENARRLLRFWQVRSSPSPSRVN